MRRLPRALLWGTGAALLLAAGAGGWLAHRQASSNSSPAAQQPPAHLAALPLRVLANAGDDVSYLGVAIADAITTRLANTRQIAVRPTSAVLPFKDAQADAATVAASLNVQHLLIGSVQPAEDGYRVSLQLVRQTASRSGTLLR